MNQIKELLEILKETPQMALWGIGMYFIFILAKAASWIGSFTLICKQLIKRYFDYSDAKLDYKNAKLDNVKINSIIGKIDKKTISSIPNHYFDDLFDAIRNPKYDYVHEDDIKKAIKILKENK